MDSVLLEIKAPTAVITLNRPQVRNALSPEMLAGFQLALDQVEASREVFALIVTGADPAFCGGADLGVLQELTAATAEEARQDSASLMRLYRRIYGFSRPVIAAVNGPAFGGGCGLATVCDMVVASKQASFAYPECRVGFVPALVAIFLLRITGEKIARELLLTARSFTAEEARGYGLVNYVVEPDDVLPKAHELAEMIAGNSPNSVGWTKQLVADLSGVALKDGLRLALQVNALARTSDDFREGVSSFLEKRAPQWSQR